MRLLALKQFYVFVFLAKFMFVANFGMLNLVIGIIFLAWSCGCWWRRGCLIEEFSTPVLWVGAIDPVHAAYEHMRTLELHMLNCNS